MTKDLVGSKKEFAQSQGRFINMLKEQDCLRIDLELAEAQIESLHSQNLANKSELQHAKAKLNIYNPQYKCDPKFKQQYEKHRHVQKDQRNKIIQWK